MSTWIYCLWGPFTGRLIAIGQDQSGESGKSHNLAQSGEPQSGKSGIEPCRANRAGSTVGPIGQLEQSGNQANQAIGQWENTHSLHKCVLAMLTLPRCLHDHIEFNIARLLAWPDWTNGGLPDRQAARLLPDCNFAIGPIGQSGEDLPDCY